MAADLLGKQQVRTDAPDDVQVQVVDGTTPTQKLAVDSSGRVSVKNLAGDGTSLGHVADALKIDIASQGLAAVKISGDGSTPAATNPVFAQIVTGVGPAVVSASNPLAVTISTELTPGTIIRGSTAGAYDKAAAVAGAGGSVNHNYTVTALKTLTLNELTVSSAGAARFDVILDAGGTPITIDTFIIPGVGGSFTKTYLKDPPTLAAGKVLRVVKVNNEKGAGNTLDLYSSWMGTEV